MATTSFTIELLDHSVIFWSVVSQAAFAQKLIITDPAGKRIVDTEIQSLNLKNVSSGSFDVGSNGLYRVDFPNNNDVLKQECAIVKQRVITKTFLFAGEDYIDKDYNDIFVTITSFSSKS